MAQVLSIDSSRSVDLLTMFKAITSPSMDFEQCPGGSPSTIPALSPCNGCPLFEVCSDECGMNDANGYY